MTEPPKNRGQKKWERDFPLVKLIADGINGIRGERKEEEQVEQRPLTYEELQLRRRREAGFLY